VRALALSVATVAALAAACGMLPDSGVADISPALSHDVDATGATFTPPLQAAFEQSTSPWYLAAAGARGPTSSAMVATIPYSPIPSDPGPS
jgi:hypothetical protein